MRDTAIRPSIYKTALAAVLADYVLVKPAGEVQKDGTVASCQATDGTEEWQLIQELRAPEGHAIKLMCDNSDFNGQPNCAVEVVGDWTGWAWRRFAADTVLECLRAAQTASKKKSPTVACLRAKSKMAPCYLRDGNTALVPRVGVVSGVAVVTEEICAGCNVTAGVLEASQEKKS